jgi:hypothetical protein
MVTLTTWDGGGGGRPRERDERRKIFNIQHSTRKAEFGRDNSGNVMGTTGLAIRVWENPVHAGCKRGAHGVTRPTNHGLAMGLFEITINSAFRVQHSMTTTERLPGRRPLRSIVPGESP